MGNLVCVRRNCEGCEKDVRPYGVRQKHRKETSIAIIADKVREAN